MPFLPIMVFAILFGLSMDYQVFLVSRMQEEWGHTGDNRAAVRRGLAASGRVVAIAAAIMFSVFAAFVLGNDATIKLFGLALASAVLFDAFVVRLIIVPSVMYQLGNANWWLPGWLDRILPNGRGRDRGGPRVRGRRDRRHPRRGRGSGEDVRLSPRSVERPGRVGVSLPGRDRYGRWRGDRQHARHLGAPGRRVLPVRGCHDARRRLGPPGRVRDGLPR